LVGGGGCAGFAVTGLARQRGIVAVGVFLFFGAAMAWLAGISLVWRGTLLDRMWRLNPRAYVELTGYATLAGIGFLLLGCALAAAGIGWFRRRAWGWWLAVAIIGTQVAGNVVNIAMGRAAEGAFGLVIAGALLLYVLRARVREVFLRSGERG
jgi:hypothetical protein